jgi:hypothetical protein
MVRVRPRLVLPAPRAAACITLAGFVFLGQGGLGHARGRRLNLAMRSKQGGLDLRFQIALSADNSAWPC